MEIARPNGNNGYCPLTWLGLQKIYFCTVGVRLKDKLFVVEVRDTKTFSQEDLSQIIFFIRDMEIASPNGNKESGTDYPPSRIEKNLKKE